MSEKRLAAADGLRKSAREVLYWAWSRHAGSVPLQFRHLWESVMAFERAVIEETNPESIGKEGEAPWS